MNYLDRAIEVISPQLALSRAVARERLILFGYDAAVKEGRRGSSGGLQKNASSESPRMAKDRMELMWDARDLERNLPIVRCVLDRFVQYVCGTIKYQAQSGDPEYDSIIESYFETWGTQVADITGRHEFRLLTELGLRSSLRDGDFGFQLVRTGDELQLRCIEADRIGDPHKVATIIDTDMVQGIRIDPTTGRPLSYQIFSRNIKSNQYTLEDEVPADQIYFLANNMRTDEYRGVTWFAPVLKQCRDLYELMGFELGAAKWASSIAGVIRTSNPLDKMMGNGTAKSVWDGAKQVQGSPSVGVTPNSLIRLGQNEDITAFDTGNRPSGAFSSGVEIYLRDIAMGLNIPYGFFDMSRFGGATVRLEAMMLQRTFARHQRNLAMKFLDPVKNSVLNNAIAMRMIPPPPTGADFRKGRWQFGAHLTADTGYDTDANIQLMANGLKSAARVAGEEGEDYEDLIDQMIKEAAMLRDRCASAGLPIELVAGARFPSATQQLAAAAQAQTPPPPSPSVEDLGDGGTKVIVDICAQVSAGTLPRESAIVVLTSVYGMDQSLAEQMVPEFKSASPIVGTPVNPETPPPTDKKPGGDNTKEGNDGS